MWTRPSGSLIQRLAPLLACVLVLVVVSLSGLSASGVPATTDRSTSATASATPISGGQPDAGLTTSHWVEGVSKIRKLGSDITIGRGRFDGNVTIGFPGQINGDLRLPPSNGYFVVFGFMPVTGAVEMTQAGPGQGTATVRMQGDGSALADVDLTMHVVIRLHDMRVDGKPLAVGETCKTASPAAINVKGQLVLRNDPHGVPPTKVRSLYDIPRFSGCGSTENLDPLISGLVSGPGNVLDSVLTLRCFRDQNCPPDDRGRM